MRRIGIAVAAVGVLLAGLATAAADEQPRVDSSGDPLPERALARLGTTRLRHPERAACVAFSPDGKTVASACGRAVRLWVVASGKQVAEWPARAQTLAFSPDGTKLASGGGLFGGPVRLRDVTTGRELFSSDAHRPRPEERSEVHCVAFAPDGRMFASTGGDGAVRLWDVDTGEELLSLQTRAADERGRGDMHALAISPDGRLLAAAWGATVRVWDLEAGREQTVIRLAGRHEFSALAFTPDGSRLVTGGHRYELVQREPEGRSFLKGYAQIRAWDPSTGEPAATLMDDAERQYVRGLAFAPDGTRLAVLLFQGIRILDATDGRTLVTLSDDRHSYAGVGFPVAAFSPDGTVLATARDDHSIRLWDAATGRERLPSPESHRGRVLAAAQSPDGSLVATGSDDGTVRVWRTATGEFVRKLRLSRGWVRAVAFSPDGTTLAAGGEDYDDQEFRFAGRVKLWNVGDGELRHDQPFSDRVMAMALSPDGTRLAAATGLGRIAFDESSDPEMHVYDVSEGRRLLTLRGHTSQVRALAFSADGLSLISAGQEDGTFRIWNAANEGDPDVLPTDRGDRDRSWTAVLSSNARFAVSRHRAELVVWDMVQRQELRQLDLPQSVAFVLAVSDDGRLLAMGANAVGDDPAPAILLHDAASGRELLRLSPQTAPASVLAFTPGGRTLLSGLTDGTTLVWDVTAAWDKLEARE